jgi:hypothetical protein
MRTAIKIAIGAAVVALGWFASTLAQVAPLPTAMRASEAVATRISLHGVSTFDRSAPIPPPAATAPSASIALAPYGYPSGYPDNISEAADQAKSFPPGTFSTPSILTTPDAVIIQQPAFPPINAAPLVVDPSPSGPPVIYQPVPPTNPTLIPGPGIADPIVQPGQVIIPGDLPLEMQEQAVIVPTRPKGQKDGALQKVSFLATYLPKLDDEGLGSVDLENSVVVAFPFPTREMPLVLTPGFDFHLLDGPESAISSGADMPPQLYDIYLQIRWMLKLNERWSLTAATTPGYYTDFEGDHSDALRITGQLLAIWEWRPQSQLIFGVVYLDREDIGFLPAGGLIWTPNDENRLEVIFPRPRFLHRYRMTAYYEDWWFIGAELGGGEWAIQREAGFDDLVSLTDYRVTAGLERKSIDYLVGMRVEIGYVFARELEYRSGTPAFDPSDTVLLRAGFFY